jgi:hypothetical protein
MSGLMGRPFKGEEKLAYLHPLKALHMSFWAKSYSIREICVFCAAKPVSKISLFGLVCGGLTGAMHFAPCAMRFTVVKSYSISKRMPCAKGRSLDQLTVHVCRRM